jgi:hypothetical protein
MSHLRALGIGGRTHGDGDWFGRDDELPTEAKAPAQVSDCRPRTADCRLQTADGRPQTADWAFMDQGHDRGEGCQKWDIAVRIDALPEPNSPTFSSTKRLPMQGMDRDAPRPPDLLAKRSDVPSAIVCQRPGADIRGKPRGVTSRTPADPSDGHGAAVFRGRKMGCEMWLESRGRRSRGKCARKGGEERA